MIITAKYNSTCPCCSKCISAGEKVEWTKGAKAKHVICNGPSVASAAPRTNYRAGAWNGCSCGAKVYADGTMSKNACFTCRHDHE